MSTMVRVSEPEGLTADPGLVRDVLSLLRVTQWAKNLLVVPIALLDLGTWNLEAGWRMAWAVLAFTIASTVVYVMNDIMDRERDRGHPTKWRRSIASGRISVPAGIVIGLVELALLMGVLSLQPWSHAWPVACYLVLNLGYSAALKHAPLVDVFVVAAGFVLRVLLGAVALDIQPSAWLLTCVFSLCLLLAIGKRRQELLLTGVAHRPALRGYTVAFTDQVMLFSGVLAAASYLLYVRTEAPLGHYASLATLLTVPLALFGIFRYLQVVLVYDGGADPVRTLLRDPALVVNAVLWAVMVGGFLLVSRTGAAT